MAEKVIAFWEKVKDVLLVDKVIDKLLGFIGMIPQELKEFYYEYRAACLIIAIFGFILVAFEGYKLFKMALYVISAGSLGILTYYFVGPFIAQYATKLLPDWGWLDFGAVAAILVALIAILLTRVAYNGMILLLGLACGFGFGYIYLWRVIRDLFNTLEFLREDTARYLIAGVMAVIAGILFILLFKHAFIVASSAGCAIFASILLQKLLVPGADPKIKFCFILIGVIIAILACVKQYKDEEKAQAYSY